MVRLPSKQALSIATEHCVGVRGVTYSVESSTQIDTHERYCFTTNGLAIDGDVMRRREAKLGRPSVLWILP